MREQRAVAELLRSAALQALRWRGERERGPGSGDEPGPLQTPPPPASLTTPAAVCRAPPAPPPPLYPQVGGSGVLVQPMTYIFDEEPPRWRQLLDTLGVDPKSVDVA